MLELTTFIKVFWNCFVFFTASTLAYLGISQEPFVLFAVLLLIDYATGLFKAKRLCIAITSTKMKYGVISKLSLLLIPIVLAIGAKALGADFHFILLAGINILILSEIYSIIGNIYSINTKDSLPEYDAVAMIGKKIRDLLIKVSGEEK